MIYGSSSSTSSSSSSSSLGAEVRVKVEKKEMELKDPEPGGVGLMNKGADCERCLYDTGTHTAKVAPTGICTLYFLVCNIGFIES